MAKSTPPAQDTPFPPKDSPVPRQDSELSDACPWCGHSIAGLALDGLCPKCGKAYEAWMLGPVPRKVVPRWIRPTAGLFGIISITGLFVYELASYGLVHAMFGAFLSLIGLVPSLILIYLATRAFCAARHPRGASVVACFGLVGAALGGPGILIASPGAHIYIGLQTIVAFLVVQPFMTFAALVIGSLASAAVSSDQSRAFTSTLSVTPKQRRAWIAKRLASEKAALLREARDRSHSSEGTPGPKTEPDEQVPH